MDRYLVKTPYGHIHFRRTGGERARTVVISHINQQSSALMIELLEALGQKVQAIAIDYPSCGTSDHYAGQPTIQDYAKCVLAVMDAAGVKQATAMGEATGAHVSIELAASYPSRIDGAVLVNCPWYPEKSSSDRAHAPLRAGNLRPADASGFPVTRTLEFVLEHDPAHSPVNPTQSWMDRINVAQMEAGRNRWQPLHALGAYDMMPAFRKIASPVLILMGEHFHYTKHLAEMKAVPQRCEGEIISGARFCATWSHAEHIAARTFRFLGLPV